MHHHLMNSPLLTDNVEEADLVFVPFYVAIALKRFSPCARKKVCMAGRAAQEVFVCCMLHVSMPVAACIQGVHHGWLVIC